MINNHHIKKYIFLPRQTADETMRLASNHLRELGVRVLNRQGIVALIGLATEDQVETAYGSGLFMTISSQAISEANLENCAPEQVEAARRWSMLKSRKFHELSKDRTEWGKSWADPEKGSRPPQTTIDPEDFKEALLAFLQVDEKEFLKRYQGKQRQDLEGKNFVEYEKLLTKRYEDPTVAYHLARLAWYLEPEFRDFLLDLPDKFLDDSFPEPRGWRMLSEISVGVVFVESSLSDGPKFSSSERSMLEAKIIAGLDLLATWAPSSANLTWVYDWQYVTIDAADGDDESDESYWRNPAMTKVDYFGTTYPEITNRQQSLYDYREDMRIRNRSSHAILIFVTPYGTRWHAYARVSRHQLTLANRNNWGNWGISNIDRIVAHEVCHLFGAADEYTGDSGTPCSTCASTHGYYDIPNGNCGACARPQQDCVMDANHRRICAYTQAQIGWADLFVELTTADTHQAGTDDTVWLDIGDRTFHLDTPNHDDRERNHVEGYAFFNTGVTTEQVKRVGIRKSPDGSYGGWKIKRVRLWVQGELICDNDNINQWLEDEYLWWASANCGSSSTIVNQIQVKVTTADVPNAGTSDNVRLYIGGRSWDLDNEGHDDFERSNTDTFNLDPGTALYESSFSTIRIHKAPDGPHGRWPLSGWGHGGWRLRGLQIFVNGTSTYNNQSIDKWLKDDDRDWYGLI